MVRQVVAGDAKTFVFLQETNDFGWWITLLGDPFWAPSQGSAMAPRMNPEVDPITHPNLDLFWAPSQGSAMA